VTTQPADENQQHQIGKQAASLEIANSVATGGNRLGDWSLEPLALDSLGNGNKSSSKIMQPRMHEEMDLSKADVMAPNVEYRPEIPSEASIRLMAEKILDRAVDLQLDCIDERVLSEDNGTDSTYHSGTLWKELSA
jgi:hypothetical protein